MRVTNDSDIEPLSAEPRPSRGVIPERVTWGLTATIAGTVIVMALPVLLIALSLSSGTADTDDVTADALFAGLAINTLWYCGLVAILYTIVRRSGGEWRNLGLREASIGARYHYETLRQRIRRFTGIRVSPFAILVSRGYLLTYLVVIVYIQTANLIAGDTLLPERQIPDVVFENKALIVAQGLVVAFAAPFAEEIMFRGFLFAGLRRYVTFLPAALISGAVFAVAHGDIGFIAPYTIVGVILASTYERSGTLYASIGVHFLFNAINFLLLVSVPGARG